MENITSDQREQALVLLRAIPEESFKRHDLTPDKALDLIIKDWYGFDLQDNMALMDMVAQEIPYIAVYGNTAFNSAYCKKYQ